jgi:hypothetical protein
VVVGRATAVKVAMREASAARVEVLVISAVVVEVAMDDTWPWRRRWWH